MSKLIALFIAAFILVFSLAITPVMQARADQIISQTAEQAARSENILRLEKAKFDLEIAKLQMQQDYLPVIVAAWVIFGLVVLFLVATPFLLVYSVYFRKLANAASNPNNPIFTIQYRPSDLESLSQIENDREFYRTISQLRREVTENQRLTPDQKAEMLMILIRLMGARRQGMPILHGGNNDPYSYDKE